jgi:hypothetical protein
VGRLKPWKLVLRIQGLFRVTVVAEMFFITAIIEEVEAWQKEVIIEELTEGNTVIIVICL